MNNEHWEVVFETSGPLQAEMLRGVLEANQVPVFLSQEGAGKAYGFTIGRLGRVQVLVPYSKLAVAERIINEYEIGNLQDLDNSEGDDGLDENLDG